MSVNDKPQNVEFKLNHGDVHDVPLKLGSQIVRRSKRIFKGVYDFAVQGGAIGTLNLYDPIHGKTVPLALPAAFIITKVMIDCLITATSGGSATVALGSGQATGDLKAAAAFGGYTGIIDGIPNGAAANAIKVPATQANPGSVATLTIAVAALTAGKFNVHIEGYLSDAQ